MKFFVIAAKEPTPAQQDAITQYFEAEPSYNFWHWLPDFWILHAPQAETVVTVRDTIGKLAPGLSVLVLDVLPVGRSWAAHGPPEWREWLDNHWNWKS